jgi:hypothetical protein
MKENEVSFGVFKNILFVKMEYSKYYKYLTKTQQSCYSNMVLTTLFFLLL